MTGMVFTLAELGGELVMDAGRDKPIADNSRGCGTNAAVALN